MEYFVGAYKKLSTDRYGETIYDEIYKSNDFQDAWEEALKWNLRGYTIDFSSSITSFDDPDSFETYAPREMQKFSFSIDESKERSFRLKISE